MTCNVKNVLVWCATFRSLALCASITFDAPGHVYTGNETLIARGGVYGSSYTLTDWRGRAVGKSAVWGEDGTAVLPRLPTGYYHLKSGGEDATFAVVPEVKTRVFNHFSFMAATPRRAGFRARVLSSVRGMAAIPTVP